MGILAWIIFGGLAGWIASRLMGEPSGCLTNVLVGVIGAFVGGLLMSFLGNIVIYQFDLRSLVVAVLGAIVFLAILRALRGPRRPVE